jgi:hypothetical protein
VFLICVVELQMSTQQNNGPVIPAAAIGEVGVPMAPVQVSGAAQQGPQLQSLSQVIAAAEKRES